MSIFDPAPAPWPSRMLGVFRIVAGAVFISFGTMKLFGYPPMPPGQPPLVLMSQVGIAGLLEFFGGIAITIGLFTRPVAFILAGEMAVAYFQFHHPQSFWPSSNMGTPAILYCFFFLYLVFAGAGAWSVDEAIARRRGALHDPALAR
ncbi:MAG: DoxX family protein [Gemmatimonadaceae bacterium]|nr:DoxX family protein [Gemmatimonadaceae bacterium]NUQ94831.1 DoxX family protein [Gemmatimonadaceae bacterium]NUR34993.1 DoxX family protein [Gemmatimonadaceae bacterium]NUS98172.1 DoxX family protein [Gemmatimonadaceae bacterium]